MLAYAVGSFALITLLSALNGFETAIFNVYESYYPDLKVSPVHGKVFETDSQLIRRIAAVKGVITMSAVLEENAIISNGDNQIVGLVKGVDEHFVDVVNPDSLIVTGNKNLYEGKNTGAWVGEGLFYKLNLGSQAREVTIMVPSRESVGVSQIDMLEDEVPVTAVIRPGDELDAKILVTGLEFAQELFQRQNEISAIEIKLDPSTDLKKVSSEIKKMAGTGYHVRNRKEQNQAVYKMFNTEKWVAFSIMSFVLLIISFNLIGSISMLIMDKKKDIGILRAMGMAKPGISAIFFNEGVFIAMAGTLMGLVTGVIVVILQLKYGFVQTNATFVTAYPVELRLSDFFLILGLCFAMGISVSLYPAWNSASKE